MSIHQSFSTLWQTGALIIPALLALCLCRTLKAAMSPDKEKAPSA